MRNAILAMVSLSMAAGLRGQSSPAMGETSIRDVTGLLPVEAVLVIDGRDLAGFVGGVRQLYGSVRSRLKPPFRGLSELLEPFLEGVIGFRLEDLANGEIDGEWAFAVIAADGRPEPALVVRSAKMDLGAVQLAPTSAVAARHEDGVLVFTRTSRLCRKYHEWRRARKPSLAAKPGYLQHRLGRAPRESARVYVDIARIRGDGGQEPMLDPAGMLLAGPIVAAAAESVRFDGHLQIDARGLELRGRLDGGVLPGQRAERYLLAKADAEYRLPPAPANTIATLCLDRSLRGFWGNLDTLLDEASAVEAKGFLSIVDQLMAASFVEDLVPSLGEPIALFAVDVVAPDTQQPKIELPAFVLVAEKRGDRGGELLKRLLSTVVTIQRFEAQNDDDEVLFSMRRETAPTGERLDVAYAEDWRGPGKPPTAAALSPTVAHTGKHIVVASTRAGAEAMLAVLDSNRLGDSVRGDVLRVAPPGLAEYVNKNIELLILDKILQDGMARSDAVRELRVFEALLRTLGDARLEWRPDGDGTSVELIVEVGDDDN